jgi:hypothetical protein
LNDGDAAMAAGADATAASGAAFSVDSDGRAGAVDCIVEARFRAVSRANGAGRTGQHLRWTWFGPAASPEGMVGQVFSISMGVRAASIFPQRGW